MTVVYEDLTSSSTSAGSHLADPATRPGKARIVAGLALAGTAAIVVPTSSPTMATDVAWTPIVITTPFLDSEASGVAETLRDAKARSGLTWTQLALAVGVSRRSLHYWLNGGNVAPNHEKRLDEVAASVLRHERDSPSATRRALTLSSAGGQSVLGRLIAETRERLPRSTRPEILLEADEDVSYHSGRVVATKAVDLPLKKI